MAVTLYTGGLARFFLRTWVNTDQSELGESLATTSDDKEEEEEEEEEATPSDVRAYFENFQHAISKALQPVLTSPLHWPEDFESQQTSISISESRFGALMIIAARAAVRNKRLSPISTSRAWFDDPAVQQIQDAESAFETVHHLVKADTWLPGSFPTVVATEVPERDLIIGSLPQLLSALAEIGQTLNTPNEITRKLAPDLLQDARDGHAAFQDLASFAAKYSLPILIDG